MTLEEALRKVSVEREELRTRGGDVEMGVTPDGWSVYLHDGEEPYFDNFDTWSEAASFALGEEVTDSTEELRAALASVTMALTAAVEMLKRVERKPVPTAQAYAIMLEGFERRIERGRRAL